VFVVFEGPEGSGKTTQAHLAAQFIEGQGVPTVLTREPGGTRFAEALRRLLLEIPREGTDALLPEVEALLFTAARADHVARVIRPALSEGRVVVCDRYIASTLAYQGGGRGLDRERLLATQALAVDSLQPDLTILLDVPAAEGLRRRFLEEGDESLLNRLDRESLEFHERVRATYLELAGTDPDHWVVVDGTASVTDVAADVQHILAERLQLTETTASHVEAFTMVGVVRFAPDDPSTGDPRRE
jgi:dTMP kinase